jgi:hypothetical protein
VHDREGDDVLEALEATGDEGAAGPGTGVANVEVIAALFGRELGAGVARDPVAEGRDLALELARGVAGLDPGCDIVFVSGGLGEGMSVTARSYD